MGEGKGSSLVHLLVIILFLVAFGFAIAAERRRSTGTIRTDNATNSTYCVYDSDVATCYSAISTWWKSSLNHHLFHILTAEFCGCRSLFDSRGKESKIGLKERGLKREKESERDLKRENERELERYEREREQDRAKREREREYKIREDERRYRARLKEWENREKEKERTRKQER
ncbi:unnamed protein product [Lactuca virosa]|uniref:Uncharacterized protein n=1 Tax=Lactuca virosa TaxID=75947 RepID=A0AAU9NHB3_9ASTR|nr:unnamed protein product [Lactuca virosa]